jgi:hypothetical protein
MDHGFTFDHFQLLRQWGGHHYDGEDARKVQARSRLEQAWGATQSWAEELQERLFPTGRVEIRKAPINQGQAFTPYTWAKIYPAGSSPKALAYTVGIDADAFVVKIDTVGTTAARAAYLALRGPDNANSPFGAVLPYADGLKLSFEQLLDWSVEAIGSFAIGYEEVMLRIGLGAPRLTLVTDEAASREGFGAWRRALLDRAVDRGSLFWLPEGGVVFRLTRSARTPDEDRVKLGHDPHGRTWAVQINEPRIAGDHNSLSAIGESPGGGRFLLRQGFLRPNERGGHTISGDEFVARTGLVPAPVEAEGLAALRQWFVVCSLDSNPARMRLATSRFVDLCAAARASADAGEAPEDIREEQPEVEDDLIAGPEAGGSYTRGARDAEAERTVVRKQGIVWLKLAEVLGEAGIGIRKGMTKQGYEVDAEIYDGPSPPLLIEIKTSLSSGDVHGGVGQLHLYPRLIPRLSTYEKILLLPGLPPPNVRAAVEACGIAIHTFSLEEDGDRFEVRFSPDFLARCGVPGTA